MQYDKLAEDDLPEQARGERGIIQTRDYSQDISKDPRENINPSGSITDPIHTPDDDEARRKKKIKWIIYGSIGLVILILAIVLPLVLIKKNPDNPVGPVGPQPLGPGQMNPYGEVAGSQVFGGSGDFATGQLKLGKLSTPLQQAVPRQFLQHLDTLADTEKVGVDWRNKNFFGKNNNITNNLNWRVDVVSPSIGRLLLTDSDTSRFSIPDSMLQKPGGSQEYRLENLGISFNGPQDTFGIKVTDVKDPQNWIVNTIGQTLIFADKYIQMDLLLPTQRIYGLGDRHHEFLLSEGAYTMWTSGQAGWYDDGRGRGGLSGAHPFVLYETKVAGVFAGLYFRNSNAMSPVIKFNQDGTTTFSFITIGGQIEVYFIAQGSAHSVIQTYQTMVTFSRLPPFWALGWQEASPAFTSGTEQDSVLSAAQNYINNGYPLDSVYLPQDSWDNTADFKLDSGKYPNPQQLVDALSGKNQTLVAYLDAGVNVNSRKDNPAYNVGKTSNSFIKSSINTGNTDGYLVNHKQNKDVVYVDWLNPQANKFWTDQVNMYVTKYSFGGVWTTMNEPFGDVAGELADNKQEYTPKRLLEALEAQDEKEPDQSWFYSFWPLDSISTYILPFVAGFQTWGNYDQNTLSLNATHANDYTDFDVHSLYPLGMAQSTYNGLKTVNDNRPFYLSKGSFSGIGQATGSTPHTNNNRTWDSLKLGLASVMRSQIFGLTHSGSDVCGYNSNGDLDEELCLRWYQLATFFPLARHSQDQSKDAPRTEPFNFKSTTKQAQLKKTMHDRMQYLRLMYTCLFETSDSGGTCIDPIQFRYNVPSANYQASANSFIFAGSLLVSPIVSDPGQSGTFQSYFPSAQGAWVNMANMSQLITGNDGMVNLNVQDTVNVHLAPGALIPFQNNSDQSLLTTAQVLAKSISLVANRDSNGQASGSLFLDKGISQSEMNDRMYEYYNIQVQANSLQVQTSDKNKRNQPHVIDQILLVNAEDLKDTNFVCYFGPNSLVPQIMNATYLPDKLALSITPRTAGLKIGDINNLYFGSTLKGDLNICNKHSFDYNIVGGKPDITGLQRIHMNLTHMAGTLDNITVYVGFQDQGIINVQWSWADNSRHSRQVFGVPKTLVNTTSKNPGPQETLEKYIVISDSPFRITFNNRMKSGAFEPVLDLQGLLYDEYLNWVNMKAYAMPSTSEDTFRGVFGLSERASKDFFYKSGVYSLFARDIDNPRENGKLPGKNTYGVHPFYMFKHSADSWVGVYHNLAQAQDWYISNDWASGQVSLSTISTGGLGDIFVILSAQTPESVIAKYQSLVGSPTLVPQWALGWNQCRWCYHNDTELEESFQGYIDNKIPLDTQWVDIDYMQDYRDFTYAQQDKAGNPGSFNRLPTIINRLHTMNMKFVPIIDAGVAYRPNSDYKAFNDGMNQDVFLKLNGQVFVGKVWPNEAAYPDYEHPNTASWWGAQLDNFHGNLAFDGLWQDMNEASNFCDGACVKSQRSTNPITAKLRYTPTGQNIEGKAIAMDVKHYNNYTELDAHSFFGTSQVAASSAWFAKNNKRPMIISRSSFAGHGKFGSMWLGDNHASVDDMEISVLQVMTMNMLGVPLVGADICGFGGDSTTKELCTRWHAVGAFYPFSRNHRACWGDAQEPWRFNNTKFDANHTYTDLMRASIQRKYSLIRYMYTHITQISLATQNYQTLYKPLFFEFPNDNGAFNDIANNVMLGGALKTSVNAKSLNATMTNFYFPAGTWCSVFAPVGNCIYNAVSQNVSLPSGLDQSYVHLREGYIVPMQDAVAINAKTTADLLNAPVDFHILGTQSVPGLPNWRAEGMYLNDDGLTTNVTGNVNQYRITVSYSRSQGENIYLTIVQSMTASNYLNTQTNCSAVNQADYLQSLYIYNASSFKMHDIYFVQVAYQHDPTTYTTVGSASYDPATNRIVYDGSALRNPICLTQVYRIAIRNLA